MVRKSFEDVIDIYGYDSWIEKKNTALDDYMFSIVVENSIQDHYFTEKIIDCFLTGTIPVYWGARRIGEYFNSQGIIQFYDFLMNGISLLSKELYELRYNAVLDNFNKCRKWIHSYAAFEHMYYPLLLQAQKEHEYTIMH